GVGRPAARSLTKERENGGLFASLSDFARRFDPHGMNKRQLDTLIASGGFDTLSSNRAQTVAATETIVRIAQSERAERESGQSSLFAGSSRDTETLKLKPVDAWSPLEQLEKEFDAVGFYLSAHPLDGFAHPLDRLGVVPSSKLKERTARGGASRVRLAGVVVGKSERISKKGNRFAFVQLTDQSGVFEVTLFSEVLAVCRDLLEAGRMVLIAADVQLQEQEVRLTAQSVEALEEAVANSAAGLKIAIEDVEAVSAIKAILDQEGKGRGRIVLEVATDRAQRVVIDLADRYAITTAARHKILTIAGIGDVKDM
ncbi:MAG: OB-fold nucleic acid binding domain-containing protein, partial [Pseudomonadota bacterium]|nr:OB-fold nucleic acid binding domain-containing protein [Pseudomonadota bacterium]